MALRAISVYAPCIDGATPIADRGTMPGRRARTMRCRGERDREPQRYYHPLLPFSFLPRISWNSYLLFQIYIYTYNGDNGTNEPTIDRLGRVIKRVGKTGNSNSREERPRHLPRPTTLLLLLRPSLLDRVFFTPVAPLARSLPYKLISRGAPPCCRLARCRTIEFSLSIYLSVCINIYIYI